MHCYKNEQKQVDAQRLRPTFLRTLRLCTSTLPSFLAIFFASCQQS